MNYNLDEKDTMNLSRYYTISIMHQLFTTHSCTDGSQGDMVAPREKFSHPAFGTFSSFGWCSEREMAFASLLSLMGYKSHVIAPGAHAWTEVEMTFHKKDGKDTTLLVSVDNTFDNVIYSPNPPSDHNNVYDRMAFAAGEVAKTRAVTVPLSARARFDRALSAYLIGQK